MSLQTTLTSREPRGKPRREAKPHGRRSKKLLICEEALKGHTGHWYEYNKAVWEINRNDGHEVTILAHNDVEQSLVDELPAEPFFRYTNWDQIYNFPQAWKRYFGVLHHNCRVYRALNAYLRKSSGFDCVLVPTVIVYHLLAWLILARRYGGNKLNRIVLFIRNSATTYENDESNPVFKRSTRILAWILRQYKPLIDKGLVRLATDSHRLAREYKALAGVDLIVFPHPRSQEALRESANPSGNGKVVMSSLGPARWEKGAHVLAQAIEILARRANVPPIHFVIQWNHQVVAPDGSLLKLDTDKLRDTPISCEILSESLSSREYNQRLHASDFLLLPYMRQAYYARISGVAVEAMLLGIPMVYTDDTWVAEFADRYGAGVGFENENAAGLADKICEVALKVEQWRGAARRRVPTAQEYFSPDNFQRCLWEG